jgi:CheY-like chemotaxis protein
MDAQSIMMFDEGFDLGIRCRFISQWFKVDSYVPSKEGLLAEIERNMPDIVVMDLYLYEKMDGIEISRKIRSQFDVPVMYF